MAVTYGYSSRLITTNPREEEEDRGRGGLAAVSS